MPPSIRRYRLSDRAAVATLWHTLFPDDPVWNTPEDVIDHKTLVQRELFFVAESGTALVGTVIAGYDGVRGWIHKLAVAPSQQRQGLALDLMRHAEAALASLGCVKVNLQVRRGNESAARFYRAAGYAEEDRLSFGKRLSAAQPTPVGRSLLHHLSLPVSDLAHSTRLYDAMLAALGYRRVFAVEDAVGYGVLDGQDILCLKAVPHAQAAGPGAHLAFAAPSRASVDAAHAAALANGASNNGSPGLRPHYGADYYAAFVIDPDGHRLEAVHK